MAWPHRVIALIKVSVYCEKHLVSWGPIIPLKHCPAGILFHASVNDEQSSFSGDVPVRSVTETVNSPATPKRKILFCSFYCLPFLGALF